MRKQIYWVLATYFTNKAFLATLAFAALFTIIFGSSLSSRVRSGATIPIPWVVGISPGILATTVGAVLARQFRTPASRLSPGFLRAHVLVGLLWLAIVAVAILACTWTAEQPLSAGLLFALGMSGWMFGSSIEVVKLSWEGPTLKSSTLDKLIGLGILTIVPLLFLTAGESMTGLSQSAQNRLPLSNALMLAAVALLGAGFTWRAYVTLLSLPGAAATFGNAPGRAATFIQCSSHFAEGSFESFFENWRTPAVESSLWNRIVRWRVGNPRTLPVLSVILGSIVLAIAPWILPVISPPHRETQMSLRLGVYSTFTLFATSILIASIWRKRLMCLDVESLRPMRRTSLEREWAASLVSDLLPPALTAGAIATLSIQLQDEWFSAVAWQALIAGWREALAMLASFSGALWLASLAFTSIIVVIERLWLGLVIAFGTFLLGGIPYGALLGRIARQMRFAPDPGAALLLLLIPAAVSVVVVACMWRLWTRIDFDRRA